MKAILSIIAASLILPLAAQDPAPPSRPPRPRQAANPEQDNGGLSRNITIRLQGTTTTGNEIDLELTGAGPTFTAQQVVGKDEAVLSCEYRVAEAEDGYRVSYSIGMQVKVAISVNQEARNYEYRNVAINGSVLCSAGKPVAIVKNGGKPLELVVSPVGETAEMKPVVPPAVEDGR